MIKNHILSGTERSQRWAANNQQIIELLNMRLYDTRLVYMSEFNKKTVSSVIGFGAMGDKKYRFIGIDDEKYLIVRVA